MSETMQKSSNMFWIWLSLRLGAGCRVYPALLERFGDAYDVFEAREERLRELVPELTEHQLRALSDKRLDDVFAVEEYCRKRGVRILRYDQDEYPLTFRAMPDPPLLLYCRGELPAFQRQLCVAVVGTRKMSEYGRGMAYKIAYELASAGAIVVSGMALGIDSVAACAAMQAGGKTVAFLGGGIDVPYPPEHEHFMDVIAYRGVLFSEFAPGSEPKAGNFPIRNRLISGLCQATVVIDADERSGALITADRAIQQGRDLFAIPANVGAANASGTNRLIRDGAHVALCAADILAHYEFLYPELRSPVTGDRSDYDPAVISEMGVYSRVVGGLFRIPAEQAGKAVPVTPPEPTPAAREKRRTRSGRSGAENAAQAVEKQPPTQPDTTDPRLAPRDANDRGDLSSAAVASLNDTQRTILEAIPAEEPISVDQLKRLGIPVGALLAAISVLQIKGLVRSLPGGMISRA